MAKGFVLSAIVLLAGTVFLPALRAQRDQSQQLAQQLAKRSWNNDPPGSEAYENKKSSAPAPVRDLSGIWDGTASGGIQGKGAIEHRALFKDHPRDDDPGHPDETGIANPLPYTAAGLAALKKNYPGDGVRAVDVAIANDPVNVGNPQGFPRMELYELRVIELTQTKEQVIYLDEFQQNYRIIWTDGRALPDINAVEPRWFGYSVGKWTDDYTFEVDTVGVDDRTWLDNVGRPHSYEMRAHEIWHRVDYDTIELTVTVDDPKDYSAKWTGLNKFVLHRLPDHFDMEEFIYNAGETAAYDKIVAGEAAAPGKAATPAK
jgi:hypothetical protein